MDMAMLDLLARWLHFLAGVIWVGHNYASVVNRPRWRPLAASDLSDPDSPKLKEVINREHGTFRWASVVTGAPGSSCSGTGAGSQVRCSCRAPSHRSGWVSTSAR